MGVIESEIGLLTRKKQKFDRLKVGNVVKVPPYGRKVRIIEKYPHLFVAVSPNGYRTCYNVGDYIVALGLSGQMPVRVEVKE